MEPVELYQCGGSYYVLDGHHRIAVARALGQRSVWARTIEIRLNQPALPVGHQIF
jgi:ParB-like chromosome segregation protein Spo0J